MQQEQTRAAQAQLDEQQSVLAKVRQERDDAVALARRLADQLDEQSQRRDAAAHSVQAAENRVAQISEQLDTAQGELLKRTAERDGALDRIRSLQQQQSDLQQQIQHSATMMPTAPSLRLAGRLYPSDPC